MVAECRKLLMMTGRIAFSSKLPWLPASATAVSSPITWIAIITIASHWVGFTLPGMIDERLVLRQLKLAQAAARTGCEPTHVVCNLHKSDRGAAQRCRGPPHGSQRA